MACEGRGLCRRQQGPGGGQPLRSPSPGSVPGLPGCGSEGGLRQGVSGRSVTPAKPAPLCGQHSLLCRAAAAWLGRAGSAASTGALAPLLGALAIPLLPGVPLDDGGCRPVLLHGQGGFAPGPVPVACRRVSTGSCPPPPRAARRCRQGPGLPGQGVALTPGLSVSPAGAGSVPLRTPSRVPGPRAAPGPGAG